MIARSQTKNHLSHLTRIAILPAPRETSAPWLPAYDLIQVLVEHSDEHQCTLSGAAAGLG